MSLVDTLDTREETTHQVIVNIYKEQAEQQAQAQAPSGGGEGPPSLASVRMSSLEEVLQDCGDC